METTGFGQIFGRNISPEHSFVIMNMDNKQVFSKNIKTRLS